MPAHLHFPSQAPAIRAVGGGNPAAKLTLSDYTADDWDSVFGGGAYDATEQRAGRRGRSLSPRQAWTRQGWFRKCADVRGKGVSTLPWSIYADGVEAGDYEAALYADTMPDAPAEVAVLEGIETCLYLIEVSLALTGQAYHLKLMTAPGERVQGSRLGRFSGLQWVNPILMEPKLTARGIESYVRTVNGAPIRVDAETVLPVFQPDPFVEVGPGSSDAEAVGMNAAVLDSMAAFLSRYMDGGLIRQTILSVENATQPQAEEVGAWWRRFIRRGDAADAKVVPTNVTPHVIGDGLKDLTDATLTEEQREAISFGMGIPASLLTGGANYAEAEVQERGFYTRTVIPQAKLIERAINKHLLADYGLSLRFEPERMEIFQRFELEKAAQVVAVVGGPVLLPDEGRHLLGRPPLADVADGGAPASAPGGTAPGEGGAEDNAMDAQRAIRALASLDESEFAVFASLIG